MFIFKVVFYISKVLKLTINILWQTAHREPTSKWCQSVADMYMTSQKMVALRLSKAYFHSAFGEVIYCMLPSEHRGHKNDFPLVLRNCIALWQRIQHTFTWWLQVYYCGLDRIFTKCTLMIMGVFPKLI